ncbi:MAG: tRNA (guanosine(37)-N1)-methyltransferase TrmD [Steroidobacteraceae bacterium]
MHIEVVTLFPEFVATAARIGVTGRAIERGTVQLHVSTPRDFATDVHRTVDDRPYGGGPGMVMKIQPTRDALHAARQRAPAGGKTIYLAADGERLTQATVRELAQLPSLVLLAGRYEGVDERLLELEIDASISIGDYVLSGGELPALVLIDAVIRLLPGVLGDAESAHQDSFSNGLLDWPHYTRPDVFEGESVPAVLLSGDHAAIARWRLKQALTRTLERRPELIATLPLTEAQRRVLDEILAERAAPDAR